MDTFAVIGLGVEINLCGINFLVINVVLLIILITYLLSIVLIIKNKILGYVLSGIGSIFLLGGQFDELYNFDTEINLTYLIPIIVLSVLIILSFYSYFKLKKKNMELVEAGSVTI